MRTKEPCCDWAYYGGTLFFVALCDFEIKEMQLPSRCQPTSSCVPSPANSYQESACLAEIAELKACCRKLSPEVLKHSAYCAGIEKKTGKTGTKSLNKMYRASVNYLIGQASVSLISGLLSPATCKRRWTEEPGNEATSYSLRYPNLPTRLSLCYCEVKSGGKPWVSSQTADGMDNFL